MDDFSLRISQSKQSMELSAPLIGEALDTFDGLVEGFLVRLLERTRSISATADDSQDLNLMFDNNGKSSQTECLCSIDCPSVRTVL